MESRRLNYELIIKEAMDKRLIHLADAAREAMRREDIKIESISEEIDRL